MLPARTDPASVKASAVHGASAPGGASTATAASVVAGTDSSLPVHAVVAKPVTKASNSASRLRRAGGVWTRITSCALITARWCRSGGSTFLTGES